MFVKPHGFRLHSFRIQISLLRAIPCIHLCVNYRKVSAAKVGEGKTHGGKTFNPRWLSLGELNSSWCVSVVGRQKWVWDGWIGIV